MTTSRKTALMAIVAGLLLTVAIFLADVLLLPLGVAAGVPYVAVVLISLRLPRRGHTICVAVGVSGLTVLGLFWSDPADLSWIVAANRLLALLAIWVTAILCLAQRHTKETSRQSESRLDAFFTDAPAGLAIMNAQSKFTKVNDSLARMNAMVAIDYLGRRPGELTGEMGQRAERRCRHVLETGQSILNFQTSGKMPGRPETTRHFISSAFPLAGDNGKPAAVGWVVVDVTEQTRADELLRRRELELRLITDNVPALISYIDAEQRYRFVNRGYVEWFGLPREEIVGKHVRDLLGEKTYESIRPNIERALTGRNVSFEEAVNLNGGDVRCVDCTFVPDVESDGAVKGFHVHVSDITARKRAEEELKRLNETLELRVAERTAASEALKESETRFRLLAENIPEAFWLSTADRSRLLYVNPAYETIWGRKATDLYADHGSRLDAFHPDDRDQVVRELEPQLRGIFRDHYAHEVRIIRPDGTVRWVWTRYVPIRDEQGNVHRIAGVAADITDRKCAEEALRKSEARHRALLDAIPDMMVRFSLDGTLLDFRGRHHKLGKNSEEMIGRKICESPMPPDVVQMIMDAAKRAVESATVQDVDYILQNEGDLRHYEVRIVKSGSDECVSLVRDITERKKLERALRASERRYAKAAEIAKLGYWDRDLDKDTVVWSDETHRIFGVDPDCFEASYDGFSNFVHPDDRERAKAMVSAAVSSGQPLNVHFRICRPDGTERVIHSVAEPHLDSSGRVVGLVGTVHDVTELKQAERDLRREQDFSESLIDTAQTIILVLDEQNRIVHFNRYTEELTGLPLDEVRGRNWLETFVPERERQRMRELLAAATRGVRVRGIIAPIVTSQGQERQIEWYGTTLTRMPGRVRRPVVCGPRYHRTPETGERGSGDRRRRTAADRSGLARRLGPGIDRAGANGARLGGEARWEVPAGRTVR